MINSIIKSVDAGSWKESEQAITRLLASGTADRQTGEQLLLQRERMRRIALDFSKTKNQVLDAMKSEVPEVTETDFKKWEKENAIEFMVIDGEKKYFRNAARNVFLVHPEAKALKLKGKKDDHEMVKGALPNIRSLIETYERTGSCFSNPKTFSVSYRLQVKSDVVAAGETIKAWLAFPRPMERQSDIKLISCNPAAHHIADSNRLQRTVYLEKTAKAGKPTVFELGYELTACGFYQPVDPRLVKVMEPDNSQFEPYLKERPPHIVFNEKIRKLSRDIAGDETNPYLVAKRIFQRLHQTIPWASAREYGTLSCIPEYCIEKGWGDCGIKTLLFMTLCRLNGIPTKWESGWTADPNYSGMHDWCNIYIEPYGWLPVDASLGMIESDDERLKWFYFGNTDSYRVVCNSDYSQPLMPAKQFFRSEPIDFQRGEVETSKANLYFDLWDYQYEVEEKQTVGQEPAKNRG